MFFNCNQDLLRRIPLVNTLKQALLEAKDVALVLFSVELTAMQKHILVLALLHSVEKMVSEDLRLVVMLPEYIVVTVQIPRGTALLGDRSAWAHQSLALVVSTLLLALQLQVVLGGEKLSLISVVNSSALDVMAVVEVACVLVPFVVVVYISVPLFSLVVVRFALLVSVVSRLSLV